MKLSLINTFLFTIKINKYLQERRLSEKIIPKKIKERIDLAIKNKANSIKKRVRNVIDISTNEKAQSKKNMKFGQENTISKQ